VSHQPESLESDILRLIITPATLHTIAIGGNLSLSGVILHTYNHSN